MNFAHSILPANPFPGTDCLLAACQQQRVETPWRKHIMVYHRRPSVDSRFPSQTQHRLCVYLPAPRSTGGKKPLLPHTTSGATLISQVPEHCSQSLSLSSGPPLDGQFRISPPPNVVNTSPLSCAFTCIIGEAILHLLVQPLLTVSQSIIAVWDTNGSTITARFKEQFNALSHLFKSNASSLPSPLPVGRWTGGRCCDRKMQM
jgi:hypothetical protein